MTRIKLSKRELVLVSILAVSLLAYLYLNFLLFPGYTKISELTSELQQKKAIAADKEAAVKKLAQLDSLLKDEQLQLEDMEKKIPCNVRLPELIVNIDGKVKEIGMDIQSISIGDVDQANKDYGIIPINVAMEGNFDGVMDFIKYIEDTEREYIIDSFELSPVKRALPMSFSISMRTFVLKDSQNSISPEPDNYYFFKHKNGKSYPFLENNDVPEALNDNIDDDIEVMEKKYEKLDDIINRVEGIIPKSKGIGEDN